MRRIGGNTTIFRSRGVEVIVSVAVFISTHLVLLSEFSVGVGVSDRVGATGKLLSGDGTLGTGGNGGGAFNGGVNIGSGATTGSCCRCGPSLLGTFCASDLFLKISTSCSNTVCSLWMMVDKGLS